MPFILFLQEGGQKEKKWKVGELEFEALMRSLDNAVSKTFLKQSWLLYTLTFLSNYL